MLKRNGWDVLEDVLRWPFMAMFWGVILPIVAVYVIFFGGWLDVVPGERKQQYDKAL